MSVRWCKMVNNLSAVDQAASDGFDSVQLTVGLLVDLSETQFIRQKDHFVKSGLAFEVCAAPLPVDVRVTQKGFNLYIWTEYLKKAVQRLAELGCRKLAWSDGRARVLPWEGEVMSLKEQLLQFLFMFCEVAGHYDITVLVEPLGPRRTNFLNTMEEIDDFIPLVGKKNLSSMISLRELTEIGLATADFTHYKHLISHVQMENPLSAVGVRLCPRQGDGYEYRPFLRALHDMDYNGVITLPDDTDNAGLTYCRTLWNE